MKRNMTVRSTRSRRSRQNEPARFRTYALMLVCGLMLVTGLFFAARHHFASMDYGMRNSRLRKQVEELEAEKRRLILAREVSLSPSEIKKAARKTGLTDPAAAAALVTQVSTSTKQKALPPSASQSRDLVIKTSAVSSAVAKVDNAYAKTEKPAKPAKGTSN
jgi:hypothetical protein